MVERDVTIVEPVVDQNVENLPGALRLRRNPARAYRGRCTPQRGRSGGVSAVRSIRQGERARKVARYGTTERAVRFGRWICMWIPLVMCALVASSQGRTDGRTERRLRRRHIDPRRWKRLSQSEQSQLSRILRTPRAAGAAASIVPRAVVGHEGRGSALRIGARMRITTPALTRRMSATALLGLVLLGATGFGSAGDGRTANAPVPAGIASLLVREPDVAPCAERVHAASNVAYANANFQLSRVTLRNGSRMSVVTGGDSCVCGNANCKVEVSQTRRRCVSIRSVRTMRSLPTCGPTARPLSPRTIAPASPTAPPIVGTVKPMLPRSERSFTSRTTSQAGQPRDPVRAGNIDVYSKRKTGGARLRR